MSGLLNGKNILLTGASRGFGRALLDALQEEGAQVLTVQRTAIAGVPCVEADLSDPRSAEKAVEQARAMWPKLDALVNNAAMLGPIGSAADNDWDAWEATIKMNLLAPVRLSQLCAQWMRTTGGGSIINLSGGGATGPRPNFSAYGAAKAALVRFTETLAVELAPAGIRVNAIAPGAMNTDMLEAVLKAGPDAAGGEYAKAVEQQAKGGSSPETAAQLAVFLASDQSRGITGRLLSAVWDPWRDLSDRAGDLAATDIYTLRRIVPEDRGRKWN